jgi:hypothetical protein
MFVRVATLPLEESDSIFFRRVRLSRVNPDVDEWGRIVGRSLGTGSDGEGVAFTPASVEAANDGRGGSADTSRPNRGSAVTEVARGEGGDGNELLEAVWGRDWKRVWLPEALGGRLERVILEPPTMGFFISG